MFISEAQIISQIVKLIGLPIFNNICGLGSDFLDVITNHCLCYFAADELSECYSMLLSFNQVLGLSIGHLLVPAFKCCIEYGIC